MSWQLGAFLVLALGLAGGFAWYERARPDARIVALVATLAAFAALGRIAFAALPNVKPTTDIVIVSGYALGGAPGFVVGAVAGLTSNFFFGQGPWTPWQMAAWGAAGLLGAGLAIVTRGRIGRWQLALVCCAVGFAFTVVQDIGDWVTYSDHSTAQLATYVGTGLGFDTIDAGGCLAFALIFGPALLHSVQRFSRRLQVSWGPRAGMGPLAVLALCGLLALIPTTPPARAASRPRPARTAQAAGSPLAYLLGAQNQDGGLGSAPGQPSNALYSGWAALAFAAEGRNPSAVRQGASSLIAYIEATVPTDPGSIERTILVAHAAGAQPMSFGGHNLIASLNRDVRPNGSVAGQVNLTTFAVLALRAAGQRPPARMLGWLARQQDGSGGFSFATAGDQPDVDDTGAALQALAGSAPSARRRAVAFIRAAQNHDGGFPSDPGGSSNAQSTAWAVQGLIAAGVNPAGVHRHGSPSPQDYLRAMTTSNGAIDYARGVSQTPVWVTAEAVVALEGKSFPLAPVPAPAPAAAAAAPPAHPARLPSVTHAAPPATTSTQASPAHPRHVAAHASHPSQAVPPARPREQTETQPTVQGSDVVATKTTQDASPPSRDAPHSASNLPLILAAAAVAVALVAGLALWLLRRSPAR